MFILQLKRCNNFRWHLQLAFTLTQQCLRLITSMVNLSLAKNIIQGPQETWNIESNIEGDAYWVFTFPQLLHNQSIWYPWHCLTSYLGFSIVNDGAQVNSCNPQVIWCIFCHCNPVDVNVSHGKNNGLVSISKTMDIFVEKTCISWTCGRAWEVRFVLSAKSWKMRKSIWNNKKNKKIPPLWSLSFWQSMTL